MVELHADFRPQAVDVARQFGHACNLLVVPKSEAVVGEPSFGEDGGRLDDDQPGSPEGARAVMEMMERCDAGRGRAVHAHGGHDYTVFQFKIFDMERFIGFQSEHASFKRYVKYRNLRR